MDGNYRDEIRKRTIRTASQVGKHHGEGPSDGAQRNARIAAMVADRKAASKAAKEQKIAQRTAAAEKRKKETLAMAKEENLDEVRLMKPTKMFKRTELNAALAKHNEDMKKLRAEISAAKKAKAKAAKPMAEEEAFEEETGTEARMKIKNVARPGDPSPTSEKSILAKQGEIKVKKVDEEIAESLSKKYGLSESLIAAARAIVEKKTQVDMEPETDDKIDDSVDDDTKSESKTHTKPKTDKEKKLAALAEPKDKITHKDVLVGRGVVRKEELSSKEKMKRGLYNKEEVEQVDEVLSKKASAGDWIRDFQKSKNPKFAGKSQEKRREMALGAYYAKQNEEVELSAEELAHIESVLGQLDEARPTVVSAPIRGANQDQSGFGVKKDTADYTISDSKKMKMKEETELEEGRGRPKKSGEAPEGDDTSKHPVQQLHKIATSIQGSEPHFEHKDGSKTKVSKQLAKHITAVYGSMRTTQEKDDFATKLHASRDSMMAAVNKHVR